jgi:uridine kinase
MHSVQTRFSRIIKRSGEVVRSDPEKITNAIYKAAVSVGGHDRSLAASLTDKVVALLNQSFSEDNLPSVEEIQDHVEKVLIEEGHARTAKAYIIYRADRKRNREEGHHPFQRGDLIPWKVLWRVLVWNVDHGIHTIDGLNEWIRRGRFAELVRLCDEAYEQELAAAAQSILEWPHRLRVVIVAGPSSSGKTTTTNKLAQILRRDAGLEFAPLALDNYFFDLEMHPKDEWGDYDFETPHALDLELINQHLAALLDGREVTVPFYNFKTGRREGPGTPFKLAANQIVLLDSLHGLYDSMTAAVPTESKFKLYIETLSQLKDTPDHFVRWTDTRLLRRMSRDRLFRAYAPAQTLGHWHYVRKSELRHIIPFLPTVDHVVNGALGYELPVLKGILWEMFPAMIDAFAGDPKRQDAFIRGQRVHDLLAKLESVRDVSAIPADSLLREFIGGSSVVEH